MTSSELGPPEAPATLAGDGPEQPLGEPSAGELARLRAECAALRAELEHWRWDAGAARRELRQIQSSRIWRLAGRYWALRRWLERLGAKLPRLAGAGQHVASAPVAPVNHRAALDERIPPGLSPRPQGRPDLVFLSIIDWDFRFQRPQQLASHFGRAGHRVFYLSVSQFLPLHDAAWALVPKAEQVVEVRLAARRAPDIYAGRLTAAELATLEESMTRLASDLAFGDVVLVVHLPFWAPLAERLRERLGWRVVYDCMDDWAAFPGIGARVHALEPELVASADLTVVTADRLAEQQLGRARRLLLARNGMDPEHYRRHYGAHPLLAAVASPVIGYFGALAAWVDVALLEQICRRFPQATVVLAGGVFDVDLGAIEQLPNVRLLGQRPYDEMPRLLFHFDVCIIPFLVNAVTEATNPVKLYEYLWSGKPVVAPRLSELVPFADLCYLADDQAGFLAGLEDALAEPSDDPRRELRRRAAEANSWSRRCDAISEAIAETWPLVSVVVVTYGGLPLTRRCLESLLGGETWPRLEVLVVDNASPDGTVAYVRERAARDPRLRLLAQTSNLGFAAANNVGIAAARGELVMLLNNDTVVPPGLLGRLWRHLERDPEIGLLCPTTNFCGNEARIDADYDDLAHLPGFAAARARAHAGQNFDLAVAAMYCVLARRAVLAAVGPLDDAFGVGMFEDDDYSLRARAAGYRVVCAEDAYVHHVGQGSFQFLPPEEYQALWERNQRYFERKWGRRWTPHETRRGVGAVASRVSKG